MTRAIEFRAVDFLTCMYIFLPVINCFGRFSVSVQHAVHMLQWNFSAHILQRQPPFFFEKGLSLIHMERLLFPAVPREPVFAHALPANRQMLHLLLFQGPQ